jgi:enamine deaminase RidA (YjgF/YER057c/UK114 family)
VIARCLQGVNPVSTGLIVEALADPCIDFEIDAWAVIPREREKGHERYRLTNARGGYLMPTLNFGNAKVIRANDHLFLQGQTGMSLDGRGFDGEGDPARQAEVAMQNVRALLADAGAAIDDVCKITTYLTDLSHRAVIEPVLARHLRDVRPVITSVVVKGLARPELNFEIDVHAILSKDGGHERFGVAGPPDLAWSQSRACRAGEFVFLQGQSGMKLDGSGLAGPGDAAAQADQAMCNVKVLLEEAGAGMQDICKITTYLTDRESRGAVYPVLGRHLNSVHPTSTGVVVKALANPDLNVVIDVFAAVTGASSPSVGR